MRGVRRRTCGMMWGEDVWEAGGVYVGGVGGGRRCGRWGSPLPHPVPQYYKEVVTSHEFKMISPGLKLGDWGRLPWAFAFPSGSNAPSPGAHLIPDAT